MSECWFESTRMRPTFTDLREKFEALQDREVIFFLSFSCLDSLFEYFFEYFLSNVFKEY